MNFAGIKGAIPGWLRGFLFFHFPFLFSSFLLCSPGQPPTSADDTPAHAPAPTCLDVPARRGKRHAGACQCSCTCSPIHACSLWTSAHGILTPAPMRDLPPGMHALETRASPSRLHPGAFAVHSWTRFPWVDECKMLRVRICSRTLELWGFLWDLQKVNLRCAFFHSS